MTEPSIRDMPSIKKILEDARNMQALKRAMPLLRPILKLLKTGEKVEEVLANVDELAQTAEELASIPDRFDDLFASRGWIMYDMMSLEVAKAAIERAESGDIDGAEDDLVNYYDAKTVSQQLQIMNGVAAFRPRMSLAQKALDDYREGRFHACVPVVLALLDGLVNELHERNRGFFAKGVKLEAWDSIAAHGKGLNALADIFQKGRRKTTTEQITIPYRHGIMHGMDLGYDNRIVAAKTWAALFATRDWALKAERGLLTSPPEEPQKTWREIIQQIRENAEVKARLQEWRAREIQLGQDVPVTGDPEAFEGGTPEHRLAEFLSYWKVRNYGYMAKCLSVNIRNHTKGMPALVREVYDSKHLRAFEFVEISDVAAAVTKIQTRLAYGESGNEMERIVEFRMINEDSEGGPAVRGKPGSTWVVMNWRGV